MSKKWPDIGEKTETTVKAIGHAVAMNVTVLILSSLAFKGISYIFRRVIAR